MEATLGAPLGVNKTLVAWFTLSSLTPDNTAGGPLGVEIWPTGASFDSITYGEPFAGQWMNGSDNWNRTSADNGGAIETLVEPNEIMLAITQDSSAANQIKLYRNGVLYARLKGHAAVVPADGQVVIGPLSLSTERLHGRLHQRGPHLRQRADRRSNCGSLALHPPGVRAGTPTSWRMQARRKLIGRAPGGQPIGYQWSKNGGLLAGATSTT